jgi:rubrerythrin
MAILRAADIVEMAMELEKSGEAFYRAVAAKATTPELRALFVDLAEQEVRHYAAFSKLSAVVRDKPIMLAEEWDEYLDYLDATVQSAFFEGPDKALAAAESATSAQQAIGMAMAFEKETMLFFHDLRDIAAGRDEEVIARIIDEERTHLRRLASML